MRVQQVELNCVITKFIVSVMGIFEYILEISSEGKLWSEIGGLSFHNKDIQMTVKHSSIYYNLQLQGYMFRLLRIIIRISNIPTQDYLIPSALWDPVDRLEVTGSVH